MKSQALFNSYSKQKAWNASLSKFREAVGIEGSMDSTGDVDVDQLFSSISTMGTLGLLKLLPAHKTAVIHLTAALKETGVDPAKLSKKKTSLLSFLLSILGFEKFDEVMDLVIHDGSFLDLKEAIDTDDKSFTGIVFSVLKTVFPPLAAIEGVIKGALKFI